MVAIDEETFRTPPFDGTPSVTWTREIGQVLTAVIDGGAKVVGFDVVFPTSIEQSAVPFGDETLGARVRGFDRDYLRALALGARAGKVVLGQVQHQDHPVQPSPGQRAAVGQGRNIRALNAHSDPDDVIRRMPLRFTVDNEPVPSMAAELAARAGGGAPAIRAGAIPNTMTLNFQGGSDDIPTYSLADLRACAEKDDKEFFRREFNGKVVLFGTLLDVEDRKITSKRWATAPERARATRCALPQSAAGSKFARELDLRRLCPRHRGQQPAARRRTGRVRPRRRSGCSRSCWRGWRRLPRSRSVPPWRRWPRLDWRRPGPRARPWPSARRWRCR